MKRLKPNAYPSIFPNKRNILSFNKIVSQGTSKTGHVSRYVAQESINILNKPAPLAKSSSVEHDLSECFTISDITISNSDVEIQELLNSESLLSTSNVESSRNIKNNHTVNTNSEQDKIINGNGLVDEPDRISDDELINDLFPRISPTKTILFNNIQTVDNASVRLNNIDNLVSHHNDNQLLNSPSPESLDHTDQGHQDFVEKVKNDLLNRLIKSPGITQAAISAVKKLKTDPNAKSVLMSQLAPSVSIIVDTQPHKTTNLNDYHTDKKLNFGRSLSNHNSTVLFDNNSMSSSKRSYDSISSSITYGNNILVFDDSRKKGITPCTNDSIGIQSSNKVDQSISRFTRSASHKRSKSSCEMTINNDHDMRVYSADDANCAPTSNMACKSRTDFLIKYSDKSNDNSNMEMSNKFSNKSGVDDDSSQECKHQACQDERKNLTNRLETLSLYITDLKKTNRNIKKTNDKLKKSSAVKDDSLRKLFTQDQIESLNKKSTRGINWSFETINNALKIRTACGVEGYEELLKMGFPFPSLRTLDRKLNDASCLNGESRTNNKTTPKKPSKHWSNGDKEITGNGRDSVRTNSNIVSIESHKTPDQTMNSVRVCQTEKNNIEANNHSLLDDKNIELPMGSLMFNSPPHLSSDLCSSMGPSSMGPNSNQDLLLSDVEQFPCSNVQISSEAMQTDDSNEQCNKFSMLSQQNDNSTDNFVENILKSFDEREQRLGDIGINFPPISTRAMSVESSFPMGIQTSSGVPIRPRLYSEGEITSGQSPGDLLRPSLHIDGYDSLPVSSGIANFPQHYRNLSLSSGVSEPSGSCEPPRKILVRSHPSNRSTSYLGLASNNIDNEDLYNGSMRKLHHQLSLRQDNSNMQRNNDMLQYKQHNIQMQDQLGQFQLNQMHQNPSKQIQQQSQQPIIQIQQLQNSDQQDQIQPMHQVQTNPSNICVTSQNQIIQHNASHQQDMSIQQNQVFQQNGSMQQHHQSIQTNGQVCQNNQVQGNILKQNCQIQQQHHQMSQNNQQPQLINNQHQLHQNLSIQQNQHVHQNPTFLQMHQNNHMQSNKQNKTYPAVSVTLQQNNQNHHQIEQFGDSSKQNSSLDFDIFNSNPMDPPLSSHAFSVPFRTIPSSLDPLLDQNLQLYNNFNRGTGRGYLNSNAASFSNRDNSNSYFQSAGDSLFESLNIESSQLHLSTMPNQNYPNFSLPTSPSFQPLPSPSPPSTSPKPGDHLLMDENDALSSLN